MSQRSLSDIKTEISNRLFSKEYLPQFILRSNDLKDFCDAIGEFVAPFVYRAETFEYIWTNLSLLRSYLENKHMIFNGTENLATVQGIAENRLKILAARGTKKMEPEIQRICNENTNTKILFKDFGECGFCVSHTSPCYRDSSTEINVSYIGMRETVVIDIKNENKLIGNDTLKEILLRYFVPKHISCILNFLTS